ncbi:Uncharacterised protein [Yersinia frederiksenii]|nr:Uncharacterised protein [Yersinia frederiksenii]
MTAPQDYRCVSEQVVPARNGTAINMEPHCCERKSIYHLQQWLSNHRLDS